VTRCPFEKEDIIDEWSQEREFFTAASAAYLNIALEPTPKSLRSAAASGRG